MSGRTWAFKSYVALENKQTKNKQKLKQLCKPIAQVLCWHPSLSLLHMLLHPLSMNLISGHMGTSLIPSPLAQCAMRVDACGTHIFPGTHILPCQLYKAFRKVLRVSLSRVALDLVMWSLALLT